MGARPEDDITTGEIDWFRHPETGLHGNQKQGPVTPSEPSLRIGRRDKCFDFVAVEKINRPLLIALGWHRENLLAMVQELRFMDGNIFEERADC